MLCFSFGLGKTELAEALATKVCSRGYWFVDDPDDFRELDGHLESGDVIVVDEVTLAGLPVNDVKKLFDVEKNRRVRCRHFNGSIPQHCPRIFCTNSPQQDFFPRFPSEGDRTGVMRRKLFQIISGDLRKGNGHDLLTTSQGQSSGGGSASSSARQNPRACVGKQKPQVALPTKMSTSLDDAEGFSFDEDDDF